jgi:hypothetical protein
VLSDSATGAGRLLAPLPCPPKEGVVYQATQYRVDVFLVDARAEPRVDDDLLSALVSLRIQRAAASAIPGKSAPAELSSMSAEEALLSGEGDGGGDSGGGLLEGGQYGADDLWMEAGLSNSGPASLLSIIIHPPDGGTCWDVFGTTNLALNGWLNLTNWAWILRTEIGETNVTLTNLWPELGFFRLGTMLDSDFDGLTDACELLTTHTERFNPDSDGDGLSDFYEWFYSGTSPQTPEPAPTLASRAVYACPVP